jgi:hypothetical protein
MAKGPRHGRDAGGGRVRRPLPARLPRRGHVRERLRRHGPHAPADGPGDVFNTVPLLL